MLYSRRAFIGTIGLAAVSHAAGEASAQDACTVYSKERQKATSPAEALSLLREGNARFASGKTINCDLTAQVKATATGQAPFAAVVGCIDSRVPPELVFDQRLGAMFCARVAGNIVNTDILGSLEYACRVAGAKAIVVLGHSECGAIKGAVDRVKLGNLTALLTNFRPAIAATKIEGPRTSANHELVQAVAENNARLTAKAVLTRSAVLRQMVAKNEIVVAAAMHDLKTGKVTFFT